MVVAQVSFHVDAYIPDYPGTRVNSYVVPQTGNKNPCIRAQWFDTLLYWPGLTKWVDGCFLSRLVPVYCRHLSLHGIESCGFAMSSTMRPLSPIT